MIKESIFTNAEIEALAELKNMGGTNPLGS